MSTTHCRDIQGFGAETEDNSKAAPTSTHPSAAAVAENRIERDSNSEMKATPTSPPNVYEEEKVLGEDAGG